MSRIANRLRGEANFECADSSFCLRPSFENLVNAEEEIGSLFALVERASQGGMTVSEITAILWHCIDHDPRPARKIVGQAVLQMGLVEAIKPVRTILAQVLQGRA
ncbi:MAG: GTA-gp10 family protein [Erythrobacter sp.]